MPSCTPPTRVPTAGPVRAEGQLAGGRRLQAHLVLDVGGDHPVPLAERAVLAHQVFGHQEHRQALGARAVSLRPGQHQVEDVLGQVVLAAGDEPLDALDVPGPVGLRYGPGPAGADVGAGVRLGQHHGAAPFAVDGQPREALLLLGAEVPQRPGHRMPAGVQPDRGVSAQDELGHGPVQRRGGRGSAQLGGQRQPVPPGVHEGTVGLPQRLGHPHRVRDRVEDRRVAVGVGERLGQRPGGHGVQLGQDAPCRVLVQVRIRRLAQQVLAPQHLEEVELDVTQVALVVAHPLLRCSPFTGTGIYATR